MDHDFTQPQPEICDICGTVVPGARLREVRGYAVCDTTNTCLAFREDEKEILRRGSFPTPPHSGTARIYPSGNDTWAE